MTSQSLSFLNSSIFVIDSLSFLISFYFFVSKTLFFLSCSSHTVPDGSSLLPAPCLRFLLSSSSSLSLYIPSVGGLISFFSYLNDSPIFIFIPALFTKGKLFLHSWHFQHQMCGFPTPSNSPVLCKRKLLTAKECSNYCTIAPISHASKVMLEILQARLHQYVSCELPDVQAGFRKGRGTRDQIANIRWIIKNARQESSRKISISALLTMPKPLTVWITINCGKLFKRWEYQTTLPVSWETCMQVEKATIRIRHGTMKWFKIGKGVHQGCIYAYILCICAEDIKWNARWITSWNQNW